MVTLNSRFVCAIQGQTYVSDTQLLCFDEICVESECLSTPDSCECRPIRVSQRNYFEKKILWQRPDYVSAARCLCIKGTVNKKNGLGRTYDNAARFAYVREGCFEKEIF